MAEAMYVLMEDTFYEGGEPVAVSADLEALKREGERIEHGQRKKPREYTWEPGDDHDGPEGTIVLTCTRHQYMGKLRIVPVGVV